MNKQFRFTESMVAAYNARCWAEAKTKEEIEAEIARIEEMWEQGPNFQFPGSAHYQYCRMEALKKIINEA